MTSIKEIKEAVVLTESVCPKCYRAEWTYFPETGYYCNLCRTYLDGLAQLCHIPEEKLKSLTEMAERGERQYGELLLLSM